MNIDYPNDDVVNKFIHVNNLANNSTTLAADIDLTHTLPQL